MAKLTRGSIRGHLLGQTMPMVFGVAAIMSVGLIDAYFIGQLGAKELAAVSFIFPITIALSSLGVGVMVGINSVIARALGEGDSERAERRANFGAVFALATGVVLGLVLYILLDPLFRLMQASEDLLPLIGQYMRPYALGLPVMLLQMGLNGVLRGPFLVLQRLTVKLREVRLVIKRIDVAQTAHQNHMHHALGGGGKMTDRLWGRL